MDETLQKHEERRVTAYLNEKLTMLIEERTEDPAVQAEFEEYQKSFLRVQLKKPKHIVYGQIPQILSILNVDYGTYLRFVNATDTELGWKTEEAAAMADYLDLLPEEKKIIIRDAVYELLPLQLKTALVEAQNAQTQGDRISALLMNLMDGKKTLKSIFTEIGIQARWSSRNRTQYMNNMLPHEFIPAVCAKTGVSPHWLLGWDGPVLAKSESTEAVMDMFVLLPEIYQRVMVNGLKSAEAAGGVYLG